MDFQSEIKRIIEAYSLNEQPIVQFRFRKLKAIDDCYSASGFPQSCSLPQLSLLPACFKEASYDGIRWWEQNAALDHLETELELDCMFHNSGKTRKELSPKEFENYIKFSDASISGTGSKPKKTFLSRLLAKIGLST